MNTANPTNSVNLATLFSKATGFSLAALLLLPLAGYSITTADPFLQNIDKQLQGTKAPPQSVITELGAYIQKNPTSYQAHFLLGTCYDRLGLLDQSLSEFKLATQYSHSDSEPILELIREQMALDEDLTTVKLLRVAEQQFPNDPNVAYWEGNYALFRKKEPKEAEAFYERALRSTAKPIAGLHLGLAEVSLSLRRYPNAIEEATKELKLFPQTPMALLVAGLALAKAGLLSVAFKPLQITYSNNKTRPDVAKYYAQAAYWHEDYAEAVEPAIVQLGLACDHDAADDDFQTKRLLARALRRLPRNISEKLVMTASQNLDNNPKVFKDPGFHRALADALSEAGMHQLAVSEYNHSLMRNGNDAVAWYRLGQECDKYNQDYPYALICYQKARALRPDMPDLENYLERLQDRMALRDADLAWRIKDWLRLSYFRMRTAFGASIP